LDSGEVVAACYVRGDIVKGSTQRGWHINGGRDGTQRIQLTKVELEQIANAAPGDDTPVLAAHQDLLPAVDDRLDPSWQPIDLGPAWRGEKPKQADTVLRRDDGVALLAPGINYLHGDSGDGKGFVGLIGAVQEIRAGNTVIWVSYEDTNEDLIVERLKQLGVTDEQRHQFIFIAPQTQLVEGAEHLAELAATTQATLLVLDSVGEAMSVEGVDEDKDRDVGPWFRHTIRLIHDRLPDLTILPIDHTTKSRDNVLYPSGSKRKRAIVTGRSYLLNARSPFAIGQIGYVQLICAKDRTGMFKRGAVAAEIKLDATDQPYRFEVRAGRDGDTAIAHIGRRNALERVREVLGEAAVDLTGEEITRIANGPDRIRPGETDLSIKTVKNALAKMSEDPEIQQLVRPGVRPESVPGRSPVTWIMKRPESVPNQP
jgi:hypothetical protein